MIYLIQTDYFNPTDPTKPLTLLKIGSTSKENLESRMNCYKVCNPRHKVICIVEGDDIIERRLHLKYKDLKYPDYGNEWFYFSQDIVDFIQAALWEGLEITNAEKSRENQDNMINELAKIYGIELKGIDHESMGKIKTKSAALAKLKSLFPEKFYGGIDDFY